jgi:hypothetical protein
LRKNPENIIKGTRSGPLSPRAASVLGAIADKSPPFNLLVKKIKLRQEQYNKKSN